MLYHVILSSVFDPPRDGIEYVTRLTPASMVVDAFRKSTIQTWRWVYGNSEV
jgi:hypothetical protein